MSSERLQLTCTTAIGSRESSMQTGQVIAQFGGGVLASVLPPAEDIPATVEGKMGTCICPCSHSDLL